VDQPAERCVFIDDNAHNTDAAEALGFHAIAHRSAAETSSRLRALGVAF
jgi:2-haloacid dehalogenase